MALKNMKIVVVGTRGIPNIQGGVETHCEELFPRMVLLGYDVNLVRRSCYVPENDNLVEFKGVKLKTLFAVRQKSMEAILHTTSAIIWAKRHKADILHIHAIGPAILVPFARLLGLKVVFTHHGPDYDRVKWGYVAKSILKLGERWGTRFANEVIVISEVIGKSLGQKYKRTDTNLIFNGVIQAVFAEKTDYIEKLGLKPRKFVFTLGRFVEEKGFDLLIRAFADLNQNEFKLVIAGDADHEIPYSRHLKKLAIANNVVLTGFIKGEELKELFSQAFLFVLPSFHEGLSISLLEAMSYKLPVLVSDIPANKQVMLPENRYFMTGDETSLNAKLQEELLKKFEPVDYDMSCYNWDKIALQVSDVYKKVVK
jgi:glycosyltransferase involved in cell wall biosynthesis